MQDIHSIGDGGRLFGGGGDRRLRPHHHQGNHQALKCPRCDSLNTKFCYYNNYNLSQPRHFCKSCRRYWTKGGVLRNVPVGGGCRKSKRSSKPRAAGSDTPRDRNRSNSHSSSDSSGLNAAAMEAASGSSTGPHDAKFFVTQSANPNPGAGFEAGALLDQGPDCGLFTEIGSFTSLIASNTEALGFGFADVLSHHGGREQHPPSHSSDQKVLMSGVASFGDDVKLQEITHVPVGLLDQTVQVELPSLHGRSNHAGEFGPLDWQPGGDQGLFDLTTTVDQTYWNQAAQWTDQDHSNLYLP